MFDVVSLNSTWSVQIINPFRRTYRNGNPTAQGFKHHTFNYIDLDTSFYGLASPHFYFALGTDLIKPLTDLFCSEKCIKLEGQYFGGAIERYGYSDHGVHFRLHKFENLKEIFSLIDPIFQIPTEVKEDMLKFIASLAASQKPHDQDSKEKEKTILKQAATQQKPESKTTTETTTLPLRFTSNNASSPTIRLVQPTPKPKPTNSCF